MSKGSGAKNGVEVDLCTRRHSPPSAAGLSTGSISSRSFVDLRSSAWRGVNVSQATSSRAGFTLRLRGGYASATKEYKGGKCAKSFWVRTTFGVGALSRAFGARRLRALVWREAGTPRKGTGLPRGGVHGLPVRMREGANPRRGPCRRESSGYRGVVEKEHKGSSQRLVPLDLASNGDV